MLAILVILFFSFDGEEAVGGRPCFAIRLCGLAGMRAGWCI